MTDLAGTASHYLGLLTTSWAAMMTEFTKTKLKRMTERDLLQHLKDNVAHHKITILRENVLIWRRCKAAIA